MEATQKSKKHNFLGGGVVRKSVVALLILLPPGGRKMWMMQPAVNGLGPVMDAWTNLRTEGVIWKYIYCLILTVRDVFLYGGAKTFDSCALFWSELRGVIWWSAKLRGQ